MAFRAKSNQEKTTEEQTKKKLFQTEHVSRLIEMLIERCERSFFI